jgi:hypothetical protein
LNIEESLEVVGTGYSGVDILVGDSGMDVRDVDSRMDSCMGKDRSHYALGLFRDDSFGIPSAVSDALICRFLIIFPFVLDRS